MFNSATKIIREEVEEEEEDATGICGSVTLYIGQQLTSNREAFEGTLSVVKI